jgi:hypothetical protein
MHTERGRRPRSDFAGKDGKERGRSRWEPPASAGGATLQRRGKSRTSINRALAPASKTPRLKPEENSPTRAARFESRAPPHQCGGSHHAIWTSLPIYSPSEFRSSPTLLPHLFFPGLWTGKTKLEYRPNQDCDDLRFCSSNEPRHTALCVGGTALAESLVGSRQTRLS